MGANGRVVPGDVNAGDASRFRDEADVQVMAVRLGQGGFQLTVSDPGRESPAGERVVTLTAQDVMVRH